MCDTLVAVGPDGVWFAKNSDREPGEAQAVEVRARGRHAAGERLSTTYLTIDQAETTHEVVLSRPTWMWGAEMGANEHGLAIGNEALFTRVPVEKTGLTGMDLLRLALERAKTAEEALELITWMLARHGQGGAAGHRNKRFRYHNAFLIADPGDAWVLETAGPYWAAERVPIGAIRTISNVLSIGASYTRVGPGTIDAARRFLGGGEAFDFRKAFADPLFGWLSGGEVRRACTARAMRAAPAIEVTTLLAALRDHAGGTPEGGARLDMPCAHASWHPTRAAGQTTGSMVSRLSRSGSAHWLTGTSAPCIGVYKRVVLGEGAFDTGPTPAHAGDDSLWWRAEALHRTVLRDYAHRRATFEPERADLESRALAADSAAAAIATWHEHRARVLDWRAWASRAQPTLRPRAFDAFWWLQSRRDTLAR